jgi:penicillin-binding protein 1C
MSKAKAQNAVGARFIAPGTARSNLAARLNLFRKLKTKRAKILFALSMLLAALVVTYLAVPLPDPLFENDYSTVILDQEGNILRAFMNSKQQWYFPPEPGLTVPYKLEQSILFFEDRHFYKHPGVNPFSLLRAMGQFLSSGKVKSGGSTITMQVIRLAFNRKRTVWNKFIEILQALKLERRNSKQEILKMYVSHAPYGGNIVGYHAASYTYFHKKPGELTWSQAATLAVLPNSPGLISPMTNPDKLIMKRNRLLKRLYLEKIIVGETYRLSLIEPLPKKLGTYFNSAPHLAQTLVSKYPVESKIIKTTIIRQHQERVTGLMKNHLDYLKGIGVRNGAALVVETKSGKVRAYVGSQDFFDTRSGGQVDGIHAPRSTGSILKPFLYAMAMDEGVILPRTLIRDIPSYFGSFSPSNANKTYNGVVTAKAALVRSLNIPAVRLLNACGLHSFYLFLNSAGMTTLFRPAEEYGLTLILGGAEATLFDMAQLYCGLGNYGTFKPLRIIYWGERDGKDAKDLQWKELLSPGACYLTLQMLRDVKRPGAEFYWDQYQDRYPIAWKTGTSYGQRDAWAVGVTPQWTIAVWVGNFSGEGNSNLSGAKSAAPLLFDIFNSLPKPAEGTWFRRPDRHLVPIEVCLDTGFAAGHDCGKTVFVLSPPSKQPLKVCPFHKRIFVTKNEKHQVCSLCWEPGNYKTVKKLLFPPDIAQYLRESGVVLSALPRHRKTCSGAAPVNLNPVRVIYPVPGAKLWIPRDFDGQLQQVTFKAAHSSPDSRVYWYIDNIYKGTTTGKHKITTRLDRGWHRLQLVDEQGHRAQRKLYVSVLDRAY